MTQGSQASAGPASPQVVRAHAVAEADHTHSDELTAQSFSNNLLLLGQVCPQLQACPDRSSLVSRLAGFLIICFIRGISATRGHC